jgi:hypothetical protein
MTNLPDSLPNPPTGPKPDGNTCYLWRVLDPQARSMARWVCQQVTAGEATTVDSYLLGGLRWGHVCALCQMISADASLEPLAVKLAVGAVDSDMHCRPSSVYDALDARGESAEIAGRCPFRR